MNLSYEENLEVESFLNTIKFNPLVELVYLACDSNGINVITVCNFRDSKNLLGGDNKKKTIKSITDSIRLFNIKNRENRLIFYSDDIANYYYPLDKNKRSSDDDHNLLEEVKIPIDGNMILLDKTQVDTDYKKKIRERI